MAKFTFNGMDELSASFEDLANLTDQDRMGIIMPAAKLLVERQKAKLAELFTQRSGALAESIMIREKSDENGAYAEIFFKGKHPGSSTGKRKKRDANGKIIESGKYSGTNAEVAYILEYGSPRIAPRHWLESANEEAEDDVVETMQTAWDELLEEKGF